MTAVVLAGLIVGLIFFAVASLRDDEYTSTATVLVKNPTAAEAVFGSGAPPTASSIEREIATSEQIAGLGAPAKATAEELEGLSADEVAGMVNVDRGSKVNLISIEATATSAEQAEQIANAYARQYIAFRAFLAEKALQEARDLVEEKLDGFSKEERKSQEGKQLHVTAAKLSALKTLQTGGAVVIDPATTPTSPSSPKPARDAFVGLLLGLVLGLGGVAFAGRRGDRLTDAEGASRSLRLPVLAVLGGDLDEAAPLPPDLETALLGPVEDTDDPARVVLLTAIRSDEDAGVAASELARLTSGRARVAIAEVGPGRLSPEAAHPSAGSHHFDVISIEMLERATQDHDLVLVDAPSINTAPEALPLVRAADAVLIVCRLGDGTEADAESLRGELDRLGASTLGVVVLNDERRTSPSSRWRRSSRPDRQLAGVDGGTE